MVPCGREVKCQAPTGSIPRRYGGVNDQISRVSRFEPESLIDIRPCAVNRHARQCAGIGGLKHLVARANEIGERRKAGPLRFLYENKRGRELVVPAFDRSELSTHAHELGARLGDFTLDFPLCDRDFSLRPTDIRSSGCPLWCVNGFACFERA